VKPPAVALSGITKVFGAVRANDAVDLTVAEGTIHGIIGENGAGKSTLVSILSGHYRADSGDIALFGETVKMQSSADAIGHGIGMVHQHFMLVPNFTVLENLMLGLAKSPLLSASRDDVRRRLADLQAAYGLDVDADRVVEKLPVGLQQRVEIIKALIGGGRILILDEPTGVLTPDETDQMFESLLELKRQGVTIILITHKLREIMAITDNVSVMRLGRMVAHRATAETTREELAELMVGRTVEHVRNEAEATPGDVVMAVNNVTVREGGSLRLDGVSLDLRAGEIVGVAGVAGNGQSELLSVLAGLRAPDAGTIEIGGRVVSADAPCDPRQMRKLGVAHVPEDRRREGLVLPFRMSENSVLGYLRFARSTTRRWFLRRSRMVQRCAELMDAFDVRPANPALPASGFSGGNQQKLVIAREHGAEPKVMLVGQPTRGVDIGAIEFIHRQLLDLRDQGCAVLLVSVELDEILALSDRIIAMNAGRIVGEVDGHGADRRTVGLMMAGIGGHSAPPASALAS